MAVRIDLTLDCADALALAEFWLAPISTVALGYEDEPPPAPFATREEWATSFLADGEEDDGGGAWLHDPAGHGPRLCLLEVPEPKIAKNRLHIDVRVSRGAEDRWPAVTTAVHELVTAGGTVVAEFAGHHVVMADPEGNEFCVAWFRARAGPGCGAGSTRAGPPPPRRPAPVRPTGPGGAARCGRGPTRCGRGR